MSFFAELDLSKVKPDPNQPRKDFDKERLQELSDSIKAIGVKQPITVRKIDDYYMIIAGERRYRASLLAEKNTIPGVVIDKHEQLSDEMIFSHQLSENLHRQDLNPVEKAEFIKERIQELKEHGIENPGQQIASELGVSPSTVSKWLGVLKISEDLRALAKVGKIRDYALLKKVDKLKGAKRLDALNQIKDGEFIAKEFFSKKRKKKNVGDGDVGDNAKSKVDGSISNNQEAKPKKEETVNIKLTVSEFKKLVEKTDFQHIVSSLSESELEELYKNPKDLVEEFKQWFIN